MKNTILKIFLILMFILSIISCNQSENSLISIKVSEVVDKNEEIKNKCKIALESIENQYNFNIECENMISSYEYLGNEINIYLRAEKNEENGNSNIIINDKENTVIIYNSNNNNNSNNVNSNNINSNNKDNNNSTYINYTINNNVNYYGDSSNYSEVNPIQNIEKINIYLDYENEEDKSEIELDLEKNEVLDVNFYVQNGKKSTTKIEIEKNEQTNFNVYSDGIVNLKEK